MNLGKMTYKQKNEFYEFMCSFITDNRRQRIEEVSKLRTRFITVALEDIYQPHNASAVLRTCDCFGIQDVHIIENKNKYNVNPDVALGSSDWLTMYRYNEKDFNTIDCLKNLKEQGYSIIAASPHNNDCPLEELDINKKTTIIFGTEKSGLSEKAIELSDGFVKIPMYGFTESFNISVSAAITIYSITSRLRETNIQWQLSKDELLDIKIEWVKNTVKSSEMIEKQYFLKVQGGKL